MQPLVSRVGIRLLPNLLTCRGKYRSLHSQLSLAHLLRSFQLGTQSGNRNRWQSDDVHGSPRSEVDRQMSDGLIVGSLDNGDEVALPEDRILRYNVATEVGNLLIHRLQTVGVLVQSLAPLRRQGAQQNVCWHGMPSSLSPSGQRTTSHECSAARLTETTESGYRTLGGAPSLLRPQRQGCASAAKRSSANQSQEVT